jgi:hypothetical protein
MVSYDVTPAHDGYILEDKAHGQTLGWIPLSVYKLAVQDVGGRWTQDKCEVPNALSMEGLRHTYDYLWHV